MFGAFFVSRAACPTTSTQKDDKKFTWRSHPHALSLAFNLNQLIRIG